MFAKVVILGASRGIGYELALQVAPWCEHLVLCARNSERLAVVSQECQMRNKVLKVSTASMDFNETSVVYKWFLRHIDAERVLYCAGVSQRGVSYNTFDQVERYIFTLNYSTPIALAKQYYKGSPRLSQTRAQRQFCYISSIAAHSAVPLRSSYCASKAAAESYLRTMAIEAKREELRVSTLLVIVGSVRTDFSKYALTETMQNWGVQDELQKKGHSAAAVAKKIYKALKNNKRTIIRAGFTPRLCLFYILGKIAPTLADKSIRSINTTR